MPNASSVTAEFENLDMHALQALLLAERARSAELGQKLDARDGHIERLERMLAKLRRMTFGRSSEKLHQQIEQLELELEDAHADRGEKACAAMPTLTPEPPGRKKPARRPLPEHLPRDIQTHAPQAQACPQCQGKLSYLGEDVSETLDYVPGHFKVIRHVCPKYSCACCSHIVQASAPSRPIERGILAPGMLAQLAVAKYAYHLPLYRQAQMYAHEGVELEGSTMSDTIGGISALRSPLVDALRRYVLALGKLHGDDVPVPVISPGKGSTKTDCGSTCAITVPPAIWFAYSPDRKGVHPQAHLESFTGILQADAFSGYGPRYQSGEIIEAACMRHARRKFHDLHVEHASPITTKALRRIAELYVIEGEIRGKSRPSCCSMPCTTGCMNPWASSRQNQKPPRRSAICSSAGTRSHAMSMMAGSRSTTILPSGHYERLPSAEKIGCIAAPIPVANVRRPCIA